MHPFVYSRDVDIWSLVVGVCFWSSGHDWEGGHDHGIRWNNNNREREKRDIRRFVVRLWFRTKIHDMPSSVPGVSQQSNLKLRRKERLDGLNRIE